MDNFNWDNNPVATLSVVNVDTGTVVASRNVARNEFPNTLYHGFGLYFQAVPGVHYDFRTYWYYATNAPRLTERSVVVTPASAAGFAPIPLTAGSYNEDMVVERTASSVPNGAYTTASMDAGTANTGNGWYEQGYNVAAPATGLPPAGSTITNLASSDHVYTLAPSYTANNVAMVDSSHSANLVPVTLNPFSALSFLTAAGHGPVTVDYQVQHSDGSVETGTLTSPDWFLNTPVVFNAQGRVDVVTGVFNNVNNGNPRLYAGGHHPDESCQRSHQHQSDLGRRQQRRQCRSGFRCQRGCRATGVAWDCTFRRAGDSDMAIWPVARGHQPQRTLDHQLRRPFALCGGAERNERILPGPGAMTERI